MESFAQNLDIHFFINLLRQFPGLIVVGNLDHQCIYSNYYTAKLFGYTDEAAILGTTPFDMRCPAVENANDFLSQNQEVIDTGKELTMLDIHTYHNNESKILLTKKTPYFENDKLAGVLCYCTELHSDTLRQVCASLIQSDKQFQLNNNSTERSYKVVTIQEKKKLSERELECMFYLLRGKTMKETAKELAISPRTVETYLEQIKEKLNCNNKAEILEYGLAEGYLNFIPKSIFSKNFTTVIQT